MTNTRQPTRHETDLLRRQSSLRIPDGLATFTPLDKRMNTHPTATADPEARQRRRSWLAVLARARVDELEGGLSRHASTHAGALHYDFLRRPERGMVMLRGRVGGTGAVFNLGEATVTRCTVRLHDGPVGTGHVLGRDRRKAELVAVLDALLQDPAHHAPLQAELLAGLGERQAARRAAEAAAAGASKVEFFTMVRGQ